MPTLNGIMPTLFTLLNTMIFLNWRRGRATWFNSFKKEINQSIEFILILTNEGSIETYEEYNWILFIQSGLITIYLKLNNFLNLIEHSVVGYRWKRLVG